LKSKRGVETTFYAQQFATQTWAHPYILKSALMPPVESVNCGVDCSFPIMFWYGQATELCGQANELCGQATELYGQATELYGQATELCPLLSGRENKTFTVFCDIRTLISEQPLLRRVI
jgi:hypothetical protein